MIQYDDSVDPADPTKKKALVNVGVAGMPQIPLGQAQPTDPTLNASDSPASKATDPSVATTPQVPNISTSQLPGITDAGGQVPATQPPPITPQVPTENPISTNGDAGGPVDPGQPPGSQPLRTLPPGMDPSQLKPTDINGMTPPPPPNGGLKPVGAAASTFGPGNDLRYSTIAPPTDFQPVATDVSTGPAIDPTVSPELQKYRDMQASAADTLSTGPSRSEIAQKTLDAFDLRAQPQIAAGIRAVGQRASALGRIGDGQTAVEALTPYTDYLNNRAALANDLSASTATGEIADRQAKLNAAQGLVGSQFGQDQGTRGEARTERANTEDVTAANLARRTNERNTGVANASNTRAETRGERSYQQQISDKAIQDAINQHLLEQSDQSQGFNQNLSLLNAASANNPASIYQNASNQAAATSAQSGQSLDDLIRQYYANQKRAA